MQQDEPPSTEKSRKRSRKLPSVTSQSNNEKSCPSVMSSKQFEQFLEAEQERHGVEFRRTRTQKGRTKKEDPPKWTIKEVHTYECSRNGEAVLAAEPKRIHKVRTKKLGVAGCPCKIVVRKYHKDDKLYVE